MVGSIAVNGQWQDCHDKSRRKGKVNGFETSYILAMLGAFVLNVVHVFHG